MNIETNKLIYRHFNCVVARSSENYSIITKYGVFTDACVPSEVVEILETLALNPSQINRTFHKSWSNILGSTRRNLVLQQIAHYISGYGSNFTDELYIPEEVLDMPGFTGLSLRFIGAVPAATVEFLITETLQSATPMKQETIKDYIAILQTLGTDFYDLVPLISNYEARMLVMDSIGMSPSDPTEVLRFVVYKATGSTLLIKDLKTINTISMENSYNPKPIFEKAGLAKMAEVFNRFKPIFLSFKPQCPSTINRIAKLSKKYHKPLVENPLNTATSKLIASDQMHWLKNSSTPVLLKALNAIYLYLNKSDNTRFYKIRNGKTWVTTKELKEPTFDARINYSYILGMLKDRVRGTGRKVYIPSNVKYGLPISEKSFVGNIPDGTTISAPRLAVGVYWENKGGASDLDVSATNIDGKIGWNSKYSDTLIYSGDITNAPEGAVEYMYAPDENFPSSLIDVTVYNGSETPEYNIIVGEGDDIDKNYMMNPDKVLYSTPTKGVQRSMMLGLLERTEGKCSFTIMNRGAGNRNISTPDGSGNYINALISRYHNSLTLNDILGILGFDIVDTPSHDAIDLSLNRMSKDILNLLK